MRSTFLPFHHHKVSELRPRLSIPLLLSDPFSCGDEKWFMTAAKNTSQQVVHTAEQMLFPVVFWFLSLSLSLCVCVWMSLCSDVYCFGSTVERSNHLLGMEMAGVWSMPFWGLYNRLQLKSSTRLRADMCARRLPLVQGPSRANPQPQLKAMIIKTLPAIWSCIPSEGRQLLFPELPCQPKGW